MNIEGIESDSAFGQRAGEGLAPRDKKFVLIAALAAVPIAIFWDTMAAMVAQWSTDTYRHGYLIPLVSLFLLWRDRAQYASTKVLSSFLGLALLAVLVVCWIVAEATAVQVVAQLSVVLMVTALCLAVLGWRVYQRIWFPLAFLIFTVPVGASIVPPLMDATATIAVAALQMLNVPALREGMLVSLPGGTFEVVEACSGFNYLNAGIALGVLVAHVMFRTPWKQVFYILAVICVFIWVNGIRAFVVMFVGSSSHMQLLVGEDHIYFGWVLFLTAMALMYWVAERYSDVRHKELSRAEK